MARKRRGEERGGATKRLRIDGTRRGVSKLWARTQWRRENLEEKENKEASRWKKNGRRRWTPTVIGNQRRKLSRRRPGTYIGIAKVGKKKVSK